MSIGFMRAQDTGARYAVFGKLPRREDFVRLNTAHPVVQEIDETLGRSLAWAVRQPGWDETAYFARGASNFQLTSADGRWVFIGGLQPSRDLAGRVYPLVAGVVRPSSEVAGHLPELPIVNELFHAGLREQLASAVENSVELIACRQFLDAQLAQRARAGAEIELAASVLERHLHRTPAAQLERDLQQAGSASLEAHLLAFVFYLALARRYAGSAPALAVLLPLPDRPGEDVLGQAAWLALYRAAAGAPLARQPQVITTGISGRPYLMLAPERLTERTLGGMWGVSFEPSSLVDPSEENPPWFRHQAYAEASYILGRQLSDPELSLHALCGILARVAQSVA